MKLKRKILTVKEFIYLVESKSTSLSETFIETHKVEPGRIYKRCECTADTVTNLKVLTKHGRCLTWGDSNGDPLISITDDNMPINKATYDGEWLTTVYQKVE